MNNQCRFLHKWDKWWNKTTQPLFRMIAPTVSEEIGTIVEQERNCLRCALTQIKINTVRV